MNPISLSLSSSFTLSSHPSHSSLIASFISLSNTQIISDYVIRHHFCHRVEPQTTAATPSKSLPFPVGHGFDLHRSGYPLIIGGIDIPHDRGYEAHSDGKSNDINGF
ncbi:uncharacterized protein LOC132313809 [Cornus florida]|uniref:uncharacterized protein LOC132313809 n=1 Tax=Cornus florida TaxID=4283 RepID=UPI002897D8EB|nr:uncharacterized protein LOC132313809 [Cornus florida]